MQEVPKYLKGRYNCTKEDMIHLGGLLFRIQVDSDRSRFVAIPQMLKELVPADQVAIMTPEQWKEVKRGRDCADGGLLPDRGVPHSSPHFLLQRISSSYKRQSGITVQEAKIRFLKVTSAWPTFGCSFFEAKVSFLPQWSQTKAALFQLSPVPPQQTCEPSFPGAILVVIGKQGVGFTDPDTKVGPVQVRTLTIRFCVAGTS